MKIVVLLKQTPDTEAKIVTDGGKINYNDAKFIINPYDEFAIEEALQIQTKVGQAEVILVTFGNADVKDRILKGLAMGADRGLIVSNDGLENTDSLVAAQVLAAAVKTIGCDMVLCGKQGIDDDNMHVGVMTAELLGWPHVNVVTKMELNGKTVRAEREVEGGQVEIYDVQLPAVFGAHKSLNTPRYASLPGIMKAKKKPLDLKTVADLGLNIDALAKSSGTEIVGFNPPKDKPKGKVFKGEPVADMVAKVVKLLREEAKVI